MADITVSAVPDRVPAKPDAPAEAAEPAWDIIELLFFAYRDFVDDPDDLDAWAAAVRPNTRAFYGETIGNPAGNVLDIETVAAIAHEHRLPLIVDNTFATPYLCRPIEWGADIVLHSATKFIDGQGRVMGGAVVGSKALVGGPMTVFLRTAGELSAEVPQ